MVSWTLLILGSAVEAASSMAFAAHSRQMTFRVTCRCEIHPFRKSPAPREGTNMTSFDVTGEGATSPNRSRSRTRHLSRGSNGKHLLKKCAIQRDPSALTSDGREVGRQKPGRVRVRYPYTIDTNWDTCLTGAPHRVDLCAAAFSSNPLA